MNASLPCAPSAFWRPERRRPEAGFTLLEILVVVAILSIVLLTALSAFSAVNRTAASIEEALAALGGAGNALVLLSDDLEALHVTDATAYRPPEAGDEPDPYRFRCHRTAEDPTDFKRLEFAARAHRPLEPSALDIAPGALARVSYFVRRIGDRYVLLRADVFDLRAAFDEDPPAAVVCENVKSLQFAFIDDEGKAHEEWDSDDGQWEYATPAAVEIQLEIAAEGGGRVYQTRIAPAMTRPPRQ